MSEALVDLAPVAPRRPKGGLLRRPLLVFGLAIVGFWLVVAAAAPWIAPYDPNAIDLSKRFLAPSAQHWAGTDEVGRDLFSRIVFGSRASLLMAFGVVAIGLMIGGPLGALVGLIGGWVDTLSMRIVDLMMSMPSMVIALALTAALGPSLINVIVALGVLSVPFYVRFARAQTLLVRELAYVRWSQQAGASVLFRVRRHVLPNILSPLLIAASLHCGGALLAGAALSFVGLGPQPPMAEWGALVNAGRNHLLEQWWYPVLPGLAVFSASLGFNMIGDALRDVLDPKTKLAR